MSDVHPSPQSGPPRAASDRMRIALLGYIVRGPVGGMAWHHLQYVLGLVRLGHEVLFLEDSDDYESCYDPTTHHVGRDPTYGLQFAKHAFDRLGISDIWCYFDAHTQRWLGPAAERARDFCKTADVLMNVSGVNPVRPWHENIPWRLFIDTDPLFTQVRHLTDSSARQRAAQHNAFFSFGELIPSGQSSVPDDGFVWQPTRQPIVLDTWPVTQSPREAPFTTVMQWDSYPDIEYGGQRFGMKSRSFELVRALPKHSPVRLEIALGGSQAPRRDLEECGWRLADPLAVTRDPWTYQDYLQRSRGEFSVAKHGYVASRCGWFSERTACYLACGRPAVVQDTGLSQWIPCGRGLLAFDDAAFALEGLMAIEADHAAHCQAARDLAAEYFDYRKVLNSLFERTLQAAPAPAQ